MTQPKEPPVKPGDTVVCVMCHGTGAREEMSVHGYGTHKAVVCDGCDGTGVQVVQG